MASPQSKRSMCNVPVRCFAGGGGGSNAPPRSEVLPTGALSVEPGPGTDGLPAADRMAGAQRPSSCFAEHQLQSTGQTGANNAQPMRGFLRTLCEQCTTPLSRMLATRLGGTFSASRAFMTLSRYVRPLEGLDVTSATSASAATCASACTAVVLDCN